MRLFIIILHIILAVFCWIEGYMCFATDTHAELGLLYCCMGVVISNFAYLAPWEDRT